MRLVRAPENRIVLAIREPQDIFIPGLVGGVDSMDDCRTVQFLGLALSRYRAIPGSKRPQQLAFQSAAPMASRGASSARPPPALCCFR